MAKPTVVIVGLGDTGVLVATRLARSYRVIAITTRPVLVSGQELGARLVDPDQWKRQYFLPLSRFRRLDRVDVHHGRVVATDLDASTVRVESAHGIAQDVHYDVLIIATGVTNGFWRDDHVEDLDAAEARITRSAQCLAEAHTIAVIGGGATGVSVADNMARRGGADVHLFLPGDHLLPQHHPKVSEWIRRRLLRDGVVIHTGHRAVLPQGVAPDHITSEPIQWSTGQEPFAPDAAVWAIGAVRPHTAFLPNDVLDDAGFVRVDEHLQMVGHPNVFAVGDVAASDPLRSSARNQGHRVVVANVRTMARGRAPRRRFRAPKFRWGSIIGVQPEGLTVASTKGSLFRVPHRLVEPLLYRIFLERGQYGGLRPPS